MSEFAETKKNCSVCNAKSKGGRSKTQLSFVDSHETNLWESVWWAWLQPFAGCIDLKCCKFLA